MDVARAPGRGISPRTGAAPPGAPRGTANSSLYVSRKEETPKLTNKQLLKTTSPDFIRNRKKKALFLCQTDILLPRKCHLLIRPGGEMREREANPENIMLEKILFFTLQSQANCRRCSPSPAPSPVPLPPQHNPPDF